LAFIFGISSEFRARNSDVWRSKVVELVKNDELLRDAFIRSHYWTSPKFLTKFFNKNLGKWGHWFEEIVIPIMMMAWCYILFKFTSPLLSKILGILEFGVYLLYHIKDVPWEKTFVWENKGE
jgi:hypothetical protein